MYTGSMVKFLSRVLLVLTMGMWVTAVSCRPAPEPDPTPNEIVQQAAQRMSQLAGFHFAIAHSGPPAYLDHALH